MSETTILRIANMLFLAFIFGCVAPAILAANDPTACSANPQSRQLDFWLGDWDVSAPGSPTSGSSKVFLDLNKCLLVERWTNGKDHNGENIFAYSSDDKSWRGMFVDNEGRVHIFAEGKATEGSAQFTGPSRGPNGESFLNRVSIVRLSADKVEQIWEKSTDQGATWTAAFKGEYTRKKP